MSSRTAWPGELVDRAIALTASASRPVLGIAGPPGAGKSTLTAWLIGELRERTVPVAPLPMDGFHLSDRSLDRLGIRARKGAIETFDSRGYLAALQRAVADVAHPVYVPGFERELEQPIAADLVIEPGPALILTEGNYLLDPSQPWSEVRAMLAEAWYIEAPDQLRRQRLIDRHIRFGKAPDEAARFVDAVDEVNSERGGGPGP
jgi:pantothenate kinase